MGAHHADHPMPTAVGVRATATAAAVVALSGAGAGIASAHDDVDAATDGGRYWSESTADDGCGPDGVAGTLSGNTVRAVGLSRDDAAGTCADPSSVGGLTRGGSDGYRSGWTPWGGSYDATSDDSAAPDLSASRGTAGQAANQPTQGAQTRPASHAQPASANPIDTPPPPGQTRLIKLPSGK